ncbi:MAG: 4-hydroxythreonine-4-phosphate dehydrogenase PdxA [Nitrospirales bacterium]
MPSKQQTKPFLAITMGDPAGIGPEIIVKALQLPKVLRICRPLVIGSHTILEQTARSLGSPLALGPGERYEASSHIRIFRKDHLSVLDPFPNPVQPVRSGRGTARSGNMAVTCIQTAVQLAHTGYVHGIVTAPINKHAMYLAGHLYPGHTEMLADLTKAKESGMMIVGGPLKISFATTHLALREVPNVLTSANILRAIRLAHQGLTQLFHIQNPRIGVAGLNPHAGENGLFGNEERRLIQPAIRQAQKQGISCTGPHPADTLFGRALRGGFDGCVAMYHDQGLIPLKTVAFGHCVNITVGLPIIRTSVDHGTAYDIAGKGKADSTSLVDAIALAARLVKQTTGPRV